MPIQDHPEIQTALQEIDSQLTAIFHQRQFAGMAAALVYDQEVIWSRGYGYANLEKQVPVDNRTVFDIGSIVKIFTDTMLMQLRDAGKVSLDDPIAKILPEFHLKPAAAGFYSPTFRQVAAHIAGIPREPGYFINAAGVPALPSMDEILKKVQDMEYVYPPMTGVHYSNLGVYIMGHALARAAGQPYKQYVREHILDPLGMHASGWDLTPDLNARRAARYVPLSGGQPRRKASDVDFGDAGAPGGGFSSTVEDLARFISFQFDEEASPAARVLNTYSLKEMRLPVFYEPWGGVGIGWWLETIAGFKTIHHGGSAPGCSAAIQLVPDLKLGIIILINEMIFTENLMAHNTLELLIPVFARVIESQKQKPARSPLPPIAHTCTGNYDTTEGWGMRVLVSGDEMKVDLSYAALPLLSFDLIPEGENTFLIQGSSFDRERLTFVAAPGGEVSGLLLWGLPFTKVAPPLS